MLLMVRLKNEFNEKVDEDISELGGSIDYVSNLIPTLIFVDINNKSDLESLSYIDDIKEESVGNLQAVEVRPTIKFDKLYPYASYRDTRVAIIDSGINSNMLEVNIIGEIDYSNTSLKKNKYLHGTGVADIINQVVPNIEILNAKITDDGRITETNVIKALEWAYANKADVINLSLGFIRDCDEKCNLCRMVDALTKRGVVMVVAAGNEGPKYGTVSCPGNEVSAITVGAVNLNGKIAEYSSRGRENQEKPDLVTSGNIFIKANNDIDCGTSFATPIITGISAAIIGKYKKSEIVKNVIMRSTDNLGYNYNEQGNGMFNINKLLEVFKVG